MSSSVETNREDQQKQSPFIVTPQSRSTVHMSVSKPPPPPTTSHLAIPPSSTSTPSSSASSPSATSHSTSMPPPSPVKISMQEHFAINVCPGPILPIPQISDFFPRFHDYPCTPPPPREKKILKEETFNGETGGGYKDGERRESNEGEREDMLDSDDEDTYLGTLEFSLLFDQDNNCLHCTIHKAKLLSCFRLKQQGKIKARHYSEPSPNTLRRQLPARAECNLLSAILAQVHGPGGIPKETLNREAGGRYKNGGRAMMETLTMIVSMMTILGRNTTNKANKLRTKTLKNTLNPVWNETLVYHGITAADMTTKTLSEPPAAVHASQWAFPGHSPQTQISMGAQGCQNEEQEEEEEEVEECDWCQERDEEREKRGEVTAKINKESGRESNKETNNQTVEQGALVGEEERGRILVSLCYNTEKSCLLVGIIRCAHLAAMDSNGYSDPFVKIILQPDMGKKSKYKTTVKKKTLNPEFNEEFSYDVSLDQLAKKTLEISVWDYDLGMSNDFIGGVELGINASGQRLKHWFECLKNKGKKVEHWHTLTQQGAPSGDKPD
ncbi:Double C2-like domain-containing protein beta [Collichthys lucidus]|uniref:Double C2-like domain-containing protein beta n=1 Tax=Collichthys lucidus TaxID=240159 RepID=A0A4U5U261_COLLU|nr:Double C2-like domain-containing protein beta [Collichthys lucidus]